MLIRRELYWQKIKAFVDKPVIKVITGMRRVGKSYFLKEVVEHLFEQEVAKENILFIDKEDLKFEFLATYTDLYSYVEDCFTDVKGRRYLFIDEVQEISEWEKAVASFSKSEKYDIYLTGSNAHLLSSELATLISGRYVEFTIYPLSFKEYLLFKGDKSSDCESDFADYLRYGGLPGIFHLEQSDETVYQYINAIYNTILLKDIVKRYNIRNIALLERFASYFFDNTGQILSAGNIVKYLKSQKIQVHIDTIQNYLIYFRATFLGYRARRYDIKGKRLFEINDKYYLNDLGIRHSVIGYRGGDIGQLLENIVYIELLRRGYSVCVGIQGQKEIDFIATRQSEKIYVQVAYLLESAETVKREFSSLLEVKDNYPKYVLSMDSKIWGEGYDGITRMRIIDFLLGEL